MIRDSRTYREFLREVSSQKKVLDVGGGDPFQKDLAKYKSWFDDCEYETMDPDPKSNPTFRGDIHDIPREDRTYDAVLCKQVLEHVHSPHIAVKEIHRVLRPGGVAFVTVPFIAPYHAKPGSYKDYYRFTVDGLEYLFEEMAGFEDVRIVPERGFIATMLTFLPRPWLQKLFSPLEVFDRFLKAPYQSHGYLLLAKKP